MCRSKATARRTAIESKVSKVAMAGITGVRLASMSSNMRRGSMRSRMLEMKKETTGSSNEIMNANSAYKYLRFL